VSGWRRLRIGFLLVILLAVAGQAWLRHSRLVSWDHTLWVAVYAIPGDDSAVTRDHLATLDAARFDEIERYLADEAASYDLPLAEPVRLEFAGVLAEQPPTPPAGGAWYEVVWWSLTMRRWAARMEGSVDAPPGEIALFVIYHDPKRTPRVPHSLALKEAQLGVVHAFADERQRGTNAVVFAHELLHVLGATDKYEPGTLQPLFPAGYADPDADPRYPQALAELMAGRIPRSATTAEIPRALDQTLVGPQTAREIRWIEEER
jgi:hypothetical protein